MQSRKLRTVSGWSAAVGGVFLLLVVVITPALAGQPIVLRLGTGDPAGASSTSTTSAKFAELANQKSNGELDVKVFYQSLGTEAGLTEQVVGGSVDMGTCAMGNLSRFTDAFLTLDLPLYSCQVLSGLAPRFSNAARPKHSIGRLQQPFEPYN